LLWFAARELHSASRASRVPAAGVELVNFRFVFQGEDQALALGNFEFADTVNG
jgi:hypothetical protein